MPFKGLCCDRWIESRKSQKEGQEKQGREKSYEAFLRPGNLMAFKRPSKGLLKVFVKGKGFSKAF